VDPHGAILDMWPQTLGLSGFLGGAVFSIVFGRHNHRAGGSTVRRFGFRFAGARQKGEGAGIARRRLTMASSSSS
jgi:hypothetical protein